MTDRFQQIQARLLTLDYDSEDVKWLAARVQELEAGIDKALYELGVPQPGYPAPVANAVDILRALAPTQRDTT